VDAEKAKSAGFLMVDARKHHNKTPC